MKDQEIEQYLNKKLSQKIAQPGKFPQPIKDYLINYLKSINFDNSTITKPKDFIRLAFFMIKNDLKEIDKCGYNGCNNYKVFNCGWNGWDLRNGCCSEHAQKNTMLEKYNVCNAMFSDFFKEKLNNTIQLNYNVENISQSDIIKEKKKQTTLKNYNVGHNSQSDIIKEKKKQTTLKNYGVENPQQVKDILDKTSQTRLEKTGYAYPLQNPKIREKAIQTNIMRFGYANVIHNPVIFEKAQTNAFKRKEYKWKTGEISIVQGYEPIVLKELEDSGYTYEKVITGASRIPTIPYIFENTQHLYFPDIFIPSENLIIEVKSEYTLNKEFDRNKAKFKAVEEAGFNFKLEVR